MPKRPGKNRNKQNSSHEKKVLVEEAVTGSEELGKEAEKLVGKDVYAKTPAPETPNQATWHTKIVEAYQSAKKAKEIYENTNAKLVEQLNQLKAQKDEIDSQKSEFDLECNKLEERSKTLDEREETILKREQDAKDEFKQLFAIEKEAWESQRNTIETEIKDRLEKLDTDETGYKRRLKKLEADEELLKEDKENLGYMIEKRAEKLAGADREELEACKGRLNVECTMNQQLREKLHKFESAQWAAGDNPAARVLELEYANDRLQEKYASYPSLQEIFRLQAQQEELDALRSNYGALEREKNSLSIRMSRLIQQSGELEALRDMKESAEAQLKIARDELRKLKIQIDGEENKEGTFPALAKIDQDANYQVDPKSRPRRIGEEKRLSLLVSEMQQYFKGEGFYYDIYDLRCFVAGLAMSRLHILQGISGTGKTSLPRLFAKFANAGKSKEGIKIVEVQAGWRDRQDLLGYYNAFEKTYRQTEFLRALYEANTPRFADTPYIVILDEMNLSRPEQYFADLLSALEGDSDEGEVSERNLVLMDRPVDDAPQNFIDGRKIRIPENVWFIGTANHDETTLEFADKTYDRAHVLELPNEPPKSIPSGDPISLSRLSYREMQEAFAAASEKFEKEAKTVREFFVEFVEPELARSFDIGIGNRLKMRQISKFVPVFLATGGKIGEAVDHILVTRALRRTVGLHDTSGEQFRALAKVLKGGWETLGVRESRPNRTIKLIEKEIRNKEPGNVSSVW
jgi:hypothetical protein